MDEDVPTQSDYELALNIACGEEAAICAFITEYGPRVRGFLKSRYPTVWEDAWQEALIRMVDKINLFDPAKGSLKSWFTKLAQNCARSILRAEKKHPCAEAHEDIETDKRRPPQEVPTLKQQKQTEHRAEQVREAVQSLPEKERRVILADLAHPDGKVPASELADAWSTNANAIYQARDRAKRKLRESLMQRGIYREDNRS